MSQFYQLTVQDIKSQHKLGILSTAGLLFNYLRIKFCPKWKISISPQKICQELGISQSQFYRAFAKLKANIPHFKVSFISRPLVEGNLLPLTNNTKEIHPQESNECTEEPDVNQVTTCENGVTPNVNRVTNIEKAVTTCETENRCEPSNHAEHSDSPNSFPDTDQIKKDSLSQKQPPPTKKPTKEAYADFWRSLPEQEREKFLNFVREKTQHFSNPIASIHDYLSSNARWQEFYQNFRVVAQVEEDKLRDWTQHPDWQVALEAMRVGVPRFMGLGDLGCSHLPREVRVAMAEYAKKHNLIWGEE